MIMDDAAGLRVTVTRPLALVGPLMRWSGTEMSEESASAFETSSARATILIHPIFRELLRIPVRDKHFIKTHGLNFGDMPE
jgi:hypothetical protein